MPPKRRTVLKSIGVSIASIKGSSISVSAEDYVEENESVKLAEASLGFYTEDRRKFPHVDPIPSFGVDENESELYVLSKNETHVKNITSSDQAVFADGYIRLPGEVFNKADLQEVPIFEGESPTNKFVVLKDLYSFPAISGKYHNEETLRLNFGGDKYHLDKGDKEEITLNSNVVTTREGDDLRVKPVMSFKNYGSVSINIPHPSLYK